MILLHKKSRPAGAQPPFCFILHKYIEKILLQKYKQVPESTYGDVNLVVRWLAAEQFDALLVIAQTSDSAVAAELSDLGVRVVYPQLAWICGELR